VKRQTTIKIIYQQIYVRQIILRIFFLTFFLCKNTVFLTIVHIQYMMKDYVIY